MFTNKLKMDSVVEAVNKVMKDEESGLRMAAHAAHREGKKMFSFQGKTYPVKVQGEEVSYGAAIEEEKDCVTKPQAKEIAKKEVKGHEKEKHGASGDVAKHVKKMHKEETFKDRLIESAYAKKSPMIEDDDSKMTPEQKKKKEKIVLSMKDKEKEFKAKYGKNWKNVMYATATKLAMKEEVEELDELKKSTLASYAKKASNLASRAADKLASGGKDDGEKEDKKSFMRSKGIARAVDRLAKEEISQPEVDKFHKKLDTLVHSTFGKSSKEKKMKEEVEELDEVGDTEKGRQALTRLIGARVQDPKGKHGLEGVKRALKRLGPARNLRGEEVEELDEKNKSHTHAAHYENDKGEWTGMNLLVAKDDQDAIRQAHEKCKDGCRLSRVERHIPVKEEVELDEAKGLDSFLKSRGMNPKTMDREKKSAWARSDAFKQWAQNRPVSSSTYQYKTASEEVEPPFEPDKKKTKVDVTDKSGAHHSAMSRVKHLARQALEKQKEMKKEMIGKAGMTSEEKQK